MISPSVRADIIGLHHHRADRGIPECFHRRRRRVKTDFIPGNAQPQRNRTETEELKPLALTGGIACGKTTAGHFLQEAGFSHIYDTDAICHDLYDDPTPELLDGMRKNWGGDVVTPDARIDRMALSERLFSAGEHADDFAALNALVHPAVEQRLRELMARDAVRGDELVLVDTLFRIILAENPTANQKFSTRFSTPVEKLLKVG